VSVTICNLNGHLHVCLGYLMEFDNFKLKLKVKRATYNSKEIMFELSNTRTKSAKEYIPHTQFAASFVNRRSIKRAHSCTLSFRWQAECLCPLHFSPKSIRTAFISLTKFNMYSERVFSLCRTAGDGKLRPREPAASLHYPRSLGTAEVAHWGHWDSIAARAFDLNHCRIVAV
jgi:hypothetical protein